MGNNQTQAKARAQEHDRTSTAQNTGAGKHQVLATGLSIVVLNYEGRDLLQQNLGSVFEAAQQTSLPFEVLVVDNGSSDGVYDFLTQCYPEVRQIRLSKNEYMIAYNVGVAAARYPIVALLNNDLRLDKNFFVHLLDTFRKENDVFAVGSKLMTFDGSRMERGRNVGVFRFGWLWIGNDSSPQEYCHTLYCGASAIYDRGKFLSLGGYDRLYSPFYSEDLDICYNAWRKGWKVLYEPKSVAYHHHMATIGRRFPRSFVLRVAARNHLLFLWRNIRSKRMLFEHLALLPFLIIGALLQGKWYYVPAVLDALALIRRIKESRHRVDETSILSDRDILRMVQAGHDKQRRTFQE